MIVILTALEIEYAAVREHVANCRVHEHHKGTLFEVGELRARPERQVALASLGMGNTNAAVLTERAINEFRPSALLFAGVAGGLRDWLKLGDVVVASHVYAYHGGKSQDDGFRTRPRSWDTPHRINQTAKHISRAPDWRRPLPADGQSATVHFGPIAAGDVVLNSRTSPLARQLDERYNDAIAVEMEGAGVALAGHLNEGMQTVTVRSISDPADGTKETTDAAGSQTIAARNAAAFAIALTARLDDGGDDDASRRDNPARPSPFSGPVLMDNARAVQVTGTHYGSSHFGTAFSGGDS